MCIAIPMRVLTTDGMFAECEGRGEHRRVSTVLLDGAAPGDWLLVHVDTARELIDAQRAALVNEALDALASAMAGGGIEGMFGDLIDREPQLPEFLRDQAPTREV